MELEEIERRYVAEERAKEILRKGGVPIPVLDICGVAMENAVSAAEVCDFKEAMHHFRVLDKCYIDVVDRLHGSKEKGMVTEAEIIEFQDYAKRQIEETVDKMARAFTRKCCCRFAAP